MSHVCLTTKFNWFYIFQIHSLWPLLDRLLSKDKIVSLLSDCLSQIVTFFINNISSWDLIAKFMIIIKFTTVKTLSSERLKNFYSKEDWRKATWSRDSSSPFVRVQRCWKKFKEIICNPVSNHILTKILRLSWMYQIVRNVQFIFVSKIFLTYYVLSCYEFLL